MCPKKDNHYSVNCCGLLIDRGSLTVLYTLCYLMPVECVVGIYRHIVTINKPLAERCTVGFIFVSRFFEAMIEIVFSSTNKICVSILD